MATTTLTEVERLTLENLHLKATAVRRELELYGMGLRAKYGGESVREIKLDGTVVVEDPESDGS